MSRLGARAHRRDHRRLRDFARAGGCGGRRVQSRDERLPIGLAAFCALTRGEQLLDSVDHFMDKRGGAGAAASAGVPGPVSAHLVRRLVGDGQLGQGIAPHPAPPKATGTPRRDRCRRIPARCIASSRNGLPAGLDHQPRPLLRPRPQRARRQQRHQGRLQQRGLAGPRLPATSRIPVRRSRCTSPPASSSARRKPACPAPERHQLQIRQNLSHAGRPPGARPSDARTTSPRRAVSMSRPGRATRAAATNKARAARPGRARRPAASRRPCGPCG